MAPRSRRLALNIVLTALEPATQAQPAPRRTAAAMRDAAGNGARSTGPAAVTDDQRGNGKNGGLEEPTLRAVMRKTLVMISIAILLTVPPKNAISDRGPNLNFVDEIIKIDDDGSIYFSNINHRFRLAYVRPDVGAMRDLLLGKTTRCWTINIWGHQKEEAFPILCASYTVLCERIIETPCDTSRPVWELIPFKWRTLESYLGGQGHATYICEPNQRYRKECR